MTASLNERKKTMKKDYLTSGSEFCGENGAWTLLEGETELRQELQRLTSIHAATATKRNPHGDLCQASGNTGSDVIVSIIRELDERGDYPYNSTVQRALEDRLGLEASPLEASPIGWLVYRSQSLFSILNRIEAGYSPASADQLKQWASDKTKIQLQGSETPLTIKLINDQWWAMKPRARNRGYLVTVGKWVREYKQQEVAI